MPVPARSLSARLAPAALVLFLAACGGADAGPAVEHQVTAAQLDALPRAAISESGQVCPSATASDSLCPRLLATANWLSDDVYAVWEADRPVLRVEDDAAVPLISTDPTQQYLAASSVGPGRNDEELVVVDPTEAVARRYMKSGTPLDSITLPAMSTINFWGYSSTVPIWQMMEPSADGMSGDVVVRAGRTFGDAEARIVFRANLPWLHLQNGRTTQAPPLFPNAVVYGFTPDGAAVWSDGATFRITKVSPRGKDLWHLVSDIAGPAVDSTDIALKTAELRAPPYAASLPGFMVDSMVVKTAGTRHAAIVGLIVSPAGDVLAARSSVPQRDSIDYVRLTPDGTPVSRFTLPKTTQMVLFGGDSALVFRRGPDPAAAGTLLWLRIGKH